MNNPANAPNDKPISPLRRTLSLIVALVWTGASGFALFYMLFVTGGKFMFIVGAGVMAFIGLYWIWADFINADPRPEK